LADLDPYLKLFLLRGGRRQNSREYLLGKRGETLILKGAKSSQSGCGPEKGRTGEKEILRA